MDFVQNLRPEHLQSFWYSASKYSFALIGTFVSLLWVTALEQEEATLYKAKLDEYRWILRLSSKSADFIDRAIHMLATSTGVLIKAIPAITDPDFVLVRHKKRLAVSGYLDRREASNQLLGYERSESEYHEDTSPEYVIGETPLSAGAASGWNADQAWYSDGTKMSDAQAVYREHGPETFSENYMRMLGTDEMPGDFSF